MSGSSECYPRTKRRSGSRSSLGGAQYPALGSRALRAGYPRRVPVLAAGFFGGLPIGNGVRVSASGTPEGYFEVENPFGCGVSRGGRLAPSGMERRVFGCLAAARRVRVWTVLRSAGGCRERGAGGRGGVRYPAFRAAAHRVGVCAGCGRMRCWGCSEDAGLGAGCGRERAGRWGFVRGRLGWRGLGDWRWRVGRRSVFGRRRVGDGRGRVRGAGCGVRADGAAVGGRSGWRGGGAL